MVKIDNVKMWESLLQWGHLGVPKEAIVFALNKQGLEYKDDKIVEIKSSFAEVAEEYYSDVLGLKEKQETSDKLTDFEKSVQRMFWVAYNYDDAKGKDCPERVDDIQNIKTNAKKLMKYARKQIASEIDGTDDIQKMAAMFPDEYQSMFIGYVGDIIKKIKEG